MLTVAEASSALHDAMPEFTSEAVLLADACGRVLHESVFAERDQPPFDRVTMDGIAISFASFAAGNRQFVIAGRQHAGEPPMALTTADACLEIMTGAVLPTGCDCIVPVERITVSEAMAVLQDDYTPESRQFIHPRGSDHKRGHPLLYAGHRIEAVDVALIASAGLDRVAVARQPVIRVISTGNELVAAGKNIADHQIRLSNGPALMALLRTHGYDNCMHDHLLDDPVQLKERLAKHLRDADVLILSGGVSMGKADLVPDALAELGVNVVFHRISQRPGKPMWFGVGEENQAVFALPGNPVSTLVCARQYVIPALSKAAAENAESEIFVTLTEDVSFAANLTFFLPVRIVSDGDGRLLATPVPTNTSGDFSALSLSDGYIELPQSLSEFSAGSSWPFRPWGRLCLHA